jgi:hypothetical protein
MVEGEVEVVVVVQEFVFDYFSSAALKFASRKAVGRRSSKVGTAHKIAWSYWRVFPFCLAN